MTNGMSYHARDGRNANAAVVVSVDGRDFDNDPVKAVAFQRQLEQAAYRAGGGDTLPRQKRSAAFWQAAANWSWGRCSLPTPAA